MKVLLIGSGGREHALALAISKSPQLTKLWIAPGNPGTAACVENAPLDPADHRNIIAFCHAFGCDTVAATTQSQKRPARAS